MHNTCLVKFDTKNILNHMHYVVHSLIWKIWLVFNHKLTLQELQCCLLFSLSCLCLVLWPLWCSCSCTKCVAMPSCCGHSTHACVPSSWGQWRTVENVSQKLQTIPRIQTFGFLTSLAINNSICVEGNDCRNSLEWTIERHSSAVWHPWALWFHCVLSMSC